MSFTRAATKRMSNPRSADRAIEGEPGSFSCEFESIFSNFNVMGCIDLTKSRHKGEFF
jgi:hypothetical protein